MANLVRAKNPTNLDAVNLNTLEPRDTVKYFNNYFDVPVEVSSNIDSVIVAYFENLTNDTESARQLASAVIYTSVKQGISPLETLDQFKKVPLGDLDTYTAMFLNFDRVGTSYLGLTNTPLINKYVERSILP